VELEHPEIPIYRQCELLGLSRSSFYYKPVGVSEYNLLLMDMIDRKYTEHPFYGILRMTAWLHSEGHQVNHKRVQRLMRLMGLKAIYPKPKLSRSECVSQRYPYLLRGLVIKRPNQVWGTDITYIRLKQGFVYLVAVMDWFSRYVLSWEVSNSLDTHFCLSALEKAFAKGAPEIFNSDQGSQFTREVRISWDGRGRFWDNIFIERLWRSVKQEEVYPKNYANVPEAISSLDNYFRFYNTQRHHQALSYRTPQQVFFESQKQEGGIS
jgi:putative transposase